MAKRVFFSFHYKDVIDFRANVVRNHWLTKPDREEAGFFDASIWGSVKMSGKSAVKRLINSSLQGTSVTCILAGSQTYARQWVRYEILKSFVKGNSLLVVNINSIPGKDQQVKPRGPNPLNYVGFTLGEFGRIRTLWEYFNGKWIEYSEISESASIVMKTVQPKFWNKGFCLAEWYPEYDWVNDDGFNNFADWID
ncbi:MAG: TIR domain-containing protein [Thermotogota bacterium]|nr:TIR domain-containing protein [Thermotogota bacterium]